MGQGTRIKIYNRDHGGGEYFNIVPKPSKDIEYKKLKSKLDGLKAQGKIVRWEVV